MLFVFLLKRTVSFPTRVGCALAQFIVIIIRVYYLCFRTRLLAVLEVKPYIFCTNVSQVAIQGSKVNLWERQVHCTPKCKSRHDWNKHLSAQSKRTSLFTNIFFSFCLLPCSIWNVPLETEGCCWCNHPFPMFVSSLEQMITNVDCCVYKTTMQYSLC